MNPASPAAPETANGTHVATNGVSAAPFAESRPAAAAVATTAPDSGAGRKRYIDRNLTEGSIPRNLWFLAWPQMLEMVLNITDQVVDLIWAGRLTGGFRAVAGVGIGHLFTQFGMMARQGLDTSARAMVARAVGAGNLALANHVALQSFNLTLLYSVLVVVVGVFSADLLLSVVGASAEVHAQTVLYLQLQFVAVGVMSIRMQAASMLHASGDPITPLKATTITRIIHVALSPVLIFGWGWFPHMGLAGASTATVVAQGIGMAINIYALFSGTSRLHLTLRGYRVDPALMKRLLNIGWPASVSGTERSVAQLMLLGIVAPFGDVALAAFAITRRMEMVMQFGSFGMGQASGTLVGQNLGAGQPQRAKQSIAWALLFIAGIGGAMGVLVFVFAHGVVRVFSHEPDVVSLGADWLRLQVAVGILMGLAGTFQQSYNTAGDTMVPMVVSLVAAWAVEIPLAWALTHYGGTGPIGLGYAAIAGMGVRLLVYVPYFFQGRWLRVKVI